MLDITCYVAGGLVAMVPLFFLVRVLVDVSEMNERIWMLHTRVRRIEEFLAEEDEDPRCRS